MQRGYGRRVSIAEVFLVGATDVNIADEIIAAAVPPDDKVNVIVHLQGANCLGASSTTAFGATTGDLTQWKSVTFDIVSTASVQGRGGSGGATTPDAANNGLDGGPAFEVTSDIRMTAASQARLFGGGGGAGSGGGGGGGSQWVDDPWIGNCWRDNGPGTTDSWINYPSGVRVYTGSGHTGEGGSPFYYGAYRYRRGWNTTDGSPNYTYPATYEGRREQSITGNPGDGGFGGRGAGPCLQGASLGAAGTLGTYDAGAGGDGGTGGGLRSVGGTGERGAPGDDNDEHAGGIGGQPGLDITLNGGSIITI